MKHFFLAVFLLFASSFFPSNSQVDAQKSVIVGPILAGQPVGGGVIAFEDIGTEEVWQVKLPDTGTYFYSWSPDGCTILFRGSTNWELLSMLDWVMREIPKTSPVGKLGEIVGQTWSFDGRSLTFMVWVNENESRIYLTDVDSLKSELIVTFNERAWGIHWLSPTELLYQTQKGYFIWDTITKQSRFYRPLRKPPSDWLPDPNVYISVEAPNEERLARYYSVNALRSFISASQEVPPPEDASPDYVATLEAIPKVPGFDIYTFNDHLTVHVEAMRQFLQFLVWSPSSTQVVVTTDPLTAPKDVNGIYVYNLAKEALQRIDNFPAMYDVEYGGYEPAWSPDSNWLVFNTPSGYVIYNLTTREMTKLSEQFNGYYMSLLWSPIMDYTKSDCSR